MTVELGMFSMPMHPPERDYATILREDQEAVILADRLGFTEVYFGEHASSLTERIPSPLMFLATVIDRTSRIRFGTGVMNLPQMHPVAVASQAAQFDHLAGGRFIMGIGPGGLASDAELFGVEDPAVRAEMVRESIDMVLALWSQDPPYDLRGKYWNVRLSKAVWPDVKVGWIPRPLQQPHPPIALSLVTPGSSSGRTAGERGWIPISGNFFNKRYLRGHWEKYVEGCEAAGRRPDPGIWRVARCIVVTGTDAEAEAYMADETNSMHHYYSYFRLSFHDRRNALHMLKPDLDAPNEAVTVDVIKRGQVIFGSPRRVLDQLVALRDEAGPFGTLLMTGHDWDDPALWRRSMTLLAEEVMPRFRQHASTVLAAQ